MHLRICNVTPQSNSQPSLQGHGREKRSREEQDERTNPYGEELLEDRTRLLDQGALHFRSYSQRLPTGFPVSSAFTLWKLQKMEHHSARVQLLWKVSGKPPESHPHCMGLDLSRRARRPSLTVMEKWIWLPSSTSSQVQVRRCVT